MFDYKQRPTTDEYRNNWERVFGHKDVAMEPLITLDGHLMLIERERQPLRFYERTDYPNGCPMIAEEPQMDDL